MSKVPEKHQEVKKETPTPENGRIDNPALFVGQSHAAARINRKSLTPGDVTALQRMVGNRAVVQMLGREEQSTPVGLEGGEVDSNLERSIQRAKTGGRPLSSDLRSKLESKLNADMSNVKVHTGSKAAQLSRDLGAKAFTHKNHIFYGAGQSPSNLKLTAHEAVHTIQQGAVPQTQRKSWTTMPNRSSRGVQRIQRASGLPSKAEAQQNGGKAGFKLFGKTTWKKFLNALDEYDQLQENDNAGKVQTLAKLQTLTLDWLNSTSRQSVKKGDAQKNDYLAQLRPTIKMLYYQAKTKGDVVDPAKINAEIHAEENRGLALGHLETYLKETGQEDQVQDTDALLNRILNRLMSAKLTKNVPPGVVGFLTASPDFKTCWQLANKNDSPGGALADDWDSLKGYSQQREKAERFVGYSPFTEIQRENRPDYVGVNITNNPKGAAPNYGRWFLEFKDNVKSRITFTARDTFSHVKDLKNVAREKQLGVEGRMESTLAYNAGAVKVLVSQELNMGKSENEIIKMMPFYIEGQVHGGLSVHDIETIVVDLPSKRESVQQMDLGDYDALQKFRQKYPGVQVRYRG